MRILTCNLSSDEEEAVRGLLAGMPFEWEAASSPVCASLESALAVSVPGLLLAACDAGSPDGFELLAIASDLAPAMPCFLLVRGADPALEQALSEAGAADAFALEQLWRFRKAAARVLERTELEQGPRRIEGLEGGNRDLDAFSYSVSHDLRSPLSVILGYSDLLLDDRAAEMADRERQMVMDIRASAMRMQGLIDDLLRLSRVSRRDVELELLDLPSMAREILEGFAAAEPHRKAVFRVEGTPVAAGDAALMRIVLENLLSNAWKYASTRSEARIEFGAARDQDGGVSYYVRDNGVGFDMDEAGRLFEPFQRLGNSRDFQGAGIGLATVQRALRKHGGRVWAESRKDQGSIFRFALPSPPTVLDKSAVSASLAA